MKTRHKCSSCSAVWTSDVKENSCPNCPESDVEHQSIVDFTGERGQSSAKRQACYIISWHGEELRVTGRSPREDDVVVGTVFTGIPYANFGKREFIVKEVNHHAHKGERSDLFSWTATCKEI